MLILINELVQLFVNLGNRSLLAQKPSDIAFCLCMYNYDEKTMEKCYRKISLFYQISTFP